MFMYAKDMFDLKVFAVCLGVFFIATFLPYFISKWMKIDTRHDKYISRNWFATVFPATLALYMIMIDGMDVLQMEVTTHVVIWAIIQGVIFTITESAQKIVLSKGDFNLSLTTRGKKKEEVKDEAK